MKQQYLVGAVALVLSQAAHSIELTDYTNTESAYEEAYVDFAANANAGNQDQASYSSKLDLTYNRRHSTADQVWSFGALGNHSMARGPNDGDSSNSTYGFSGNGTMDRYIRPQKDNLFWFGAASYAHQKDAIDDEIGLTVGLGFGRIYNATPLARALRIAEDLSGDDLKRSQIPDDVMLRLSDIIGKEDQYRVTHGADSYKGVWYTDMESVLAEAGLLVDGKLSALSTISLDNVLFNENISARRHGWLVRLGAGFQSSDFSGIVDNDPKLLFQAEYARPYGLRGQLLNTLSFEPVFGDNTVAKLGNLLSYSYEVSDRIDWINSWEFSTQRADDANDSSYTSNTLVSSFTYSLTNELDLGLRFAAVDVIDRPNLNRDNDDVSTTMNLGLRYRLR